MAIKNESMTKDISKLLQSRKVKSSKELIKESFAIKSSQEFEKLRIYCQKAFEKNIFDFFDNKVLADVVFEFNSEIKYCHSSILIARIPNLYNHLINQFKFDNSYFKHSNRIHLEVPSLIDSKIFISFLKKVYCNDDVQNDEFVLINKFKNLKMDSKNFLNEKFKPLSKENNQNETKEKDESDFDVCDEKENFQPFISNLSNDLEKKNKDNWESISFTLKQDFEILDQDSVEKSVLSPNQENKESLQHDTFDEINLNECQIARSGTYDLICSVPLDQVNEIDNSTDLEKDKHFQSSKLTKIAPSSKTKISKNKFTKDSSKKKMNEINIRTELSKPCQNVSSFSYSPGTMFQFFVDIDSHNKKAQNNDRCESEFTFVHSNSNKNEKFSKFEKTKNSSVCESSLKICSFQDKACSKIKSFLCENSNHCNPKTFTSTNSESAIKISKNFPDLVKTDNQKTIGLWNSNEVKQDVEKSSIDPNSFRSLSSNSSLTFENKNLVMSDLKASNQTHKTLNTKKSFENDNLFFNQILLHSCSKLGEDLLKLFNNQIETDIELKVENKIIKAHKCILVSRSPYFAALFTGKCSETKSSFINLQGFSYNTVYFALSHLYSGSIFIPKEINIAELELLSDHLALETLKEVVIYQLKKNYCHFFHKPCSDCSVGVIDCMLLTSHSGNHQLYQKCISWVGKYFVNIWPTKSFASISSVLMNACYQATVSQISPNNLIEVILNAEKLAKTLTKAKWAQPIFLLISQLLEECRTYISSHYDLIVQSKSFISLGRNLCWNISTLEEHFFIAFTDITPDIACKTLVSLQNLIFSAESESAFGYGPYTDNYVIFIKKLFKHCERYLIHNATLAVHCNAWPLLSSSLQQHIRDSAVIVYEFEKPLAPKPQLSSLSREVKFSSSNVNETKKIKNANCKKSNKISLNFESKRKEKKSVHSQVAFDLDNQDDLAISIDENNKSKKEKIKNEKKGKVAKMSPFLYKSAHSSKQKKNSDKFIEKLDTELFNVNNCLQEAKILEQELVRKLKRQQELCKKSNNQNITKIENNQTSHLNHLKLSKDTKKSSNRPPFK